MVHIPEELLQRITSSKAKALGEPYEEIPPFPVDDGEPVALPDGVSPVREVPAVIPDELLQREASSRDATLASLPPAPVRNTVPKKVAPKPKAEPVSAAAPAPQARTVAAPAAPATTGPAAAPAVAADVSAIPEKLLRRSAEARAKASGRPVDEVLAEMTGGQPLAPAVAAAPAAAVVDEPAAPAEPVVAAAPTVVPVAVSLEEAAASLGMPEKLLRRSAEAKAKALGVSLEQVLADMLGVSSAPAAPAEPTVAPAAAEPVVAAAVVPVAVSLEEAAASLGMPEKLLRRSAEAKAKALGVSLDQVLADMLGVSSAPAAPAEPTVVPAAAEPAAAPAAVATEAMPAPADAPAAAEAPKPIQEDAPASDEVDPWPALFRIEFFTAIVSVAFLVLLALAGPAPLFEPAGGAVDPSKAPWYLLWIQQLLAWLQPQVAAFYLPLLIIVGLFAVPFVDRAPDRRGRRVGILVFGFFVLVLIVLTIVGFISRTTGFGYPWIVS